MSKSKIVGVMALIAFAMGILLVGDAVAGEKGKVASRIVYLATGVHTLKVPDMDDHINWLVEAKGIYSSEKWGAALVYQVATMDSIKGSALSQGYDRWTFPDGSVIDIKWEGKGTGGSTEGTVTLIKGTGKFEGIQGKGTFKAQMLSADQYYGHQEINYTLP